VSLDDDAREEAAGVQRGAINTPTSRGDGVRDEAAGMQRDTINTTTSRDASEAEGSDRGEPRGHHAGAALGVQVQLGA
jgi:hypothetical protein